MTDAAIAAHRAAYQADIDKANGVNMAGYGERGEYDLVVSYHLSLTHGTTAINAYADDGLVIVESIESNGTTAIVRMCTKEAEMFANVLRRMAEEGKVK